MLNRDTVGTFEIAEAFGSFKMITCMHKHYTVDEWVAWAEAHPELLDYVAVSSGTGNEDFEKMNAILSRVDVSFICLDVANGYSEHVSSHVNSCIQLIIFLSFHAVCKPCAPH